MRALSLMHNLTHHLTKGPIHAHGKQTIKISTKVKVRRCTQNPNACWNGHGIMKGLIMFVPYTHILVQVVKLIYRCFWEFLTFFDSCNLSLLMGSSITRTQEVETLLKNTREVQENLSITKTVQVLKIWATMAFAQSVWKEWERFDTLPHKALLGT